MSALQRTLVTACILCLFTLLGMSSSAQVADANWAAYNRTLAGDRFSPLKEINRSNVAKLKAICTYTLPEVSSLQTGPLVIDGTMYFTTDEGSYAIDASTCAEKWKQHRHSDTPSMLLVNRGFAYANGRLFRGTSDSHVLAMDPADGHVLWDHVLDIQGPGVSIPMAPIAANGLVYIGNAGGDQVGVTGHVYALDAKDGHAVWKFDVVRRLARRVRRGRIQSIRSPAARSGHRSPSMNAKVCCTCPRAIRRLISTPNGGPATTSIPTQSLRSTRRMDGCWATTN
jgi:glucose dehydrogenase